ncbi:hypothetical protein AAHA92_15281 [Salvia divinorum]|uniref:Uncharacterized protein n=1 Tax=Salvia divinorum TaxID=28513 RepID=A0ABD1HI98_SALDI
MCPRIYFPLRPQCGKKSRNPMEENTNHIFFFISRTTVAGLQGCLKKLTSTVFMFESMRFGGFSRSRFTIQGSTDSARPKYRKGDRTRRMWLARKKRYVSFVFT